MLSVGDMLYFSSGKHYKIIVGEKKINESKAWKDSETVVCFSVTKDGGEPEGNNYNEYRKDWLLERIELGWVECFQ